MINKTSQVLLCIHVKPRQTCQHLGAVSYRKPLNSRLFFAGINSWKSCKHGWSCQITKESFRSNIQYSAFIIAHCLRRKHRPLSMHFTHGAFSGSITFNVNKALFLHWLADNIVLRVSKVLLWSNISTIRGYGRSSESFRRAPWWCCAMARNESESFLTIRFIKNLRFNSVWMTFEIDILAFMPWLYAPFTALHFIVSEVT